MLEESVSNSRASLSLDVKTTAISWQNKDSSLTVVGYFQIGQVCWKLSGNNCRMKTQETRIEQPVA